MMTSTVEALWLRLQTILRAFAEGLVAADPTLSLSIGCSANDAFLLRGYLALQRLSDGDEIAITVDVRRDGEQLALESDACTDAGGVIATGPSAVIPLADGQMSVEARFGDWLLEFERFLKENEQAVAVAARKLM